MEPTLVIGKGSITGSASIKDGISIQDVVNASGLTADNIDLQIFRNRSEMEAVITIKGTDTVINRIPVKWKARESKLDYLSVSKISSYEQCPACFYHEYLSDETTHVDNSNYYTKFGSILHEVVEVIARTYRDCGIVLPTEQVFEDAWSHYDLNEFDAYEEAKALALNYFAKNPIDKRPETPVVVEEEWRGELGGCTFGLMVDYAGIMKNNQSVGLLRDYKTNRMPFTPADLKSSLQLRIYQTVLSRHIMPEVDKWIAGYDLFFYDWQQCPTFTSDDLKNAENYVAQMNKRITTDTVWEEKLNKYCAYRECRHNCPTYHKAINSAFTENPVVSNNAIDFGLLLNEYDNASALERASKLRRQECMEILKQEVEYRNKNNEKLIINDQELGLYSNAVKSYRYNDTKNVLLVLNKLDILDDCLNIDTNKFDKKVKSDPSLRLSLAGCVQNGYASPYIVKKKV